MASYAEGPFGEWMSRKLGDSLMGGRTVGGLCEYSGGGWGDGRRTLAVVGEGFEVSAQRVVHHDSGFVQAVDDKVNFGFGLAHASRFSLPKNSPSGNLSPHPSSTSLNIFSNPLRNGFPSAPPFPLLNPRDNRSSHPNTRPPLTLTIPPTPHRSNKPTRSLTSLGSIPLQTFKLLSISPNSSMRQTSRATEARYHLSQPLGGNLPA